jgi:hypothetical protein
MAATTAIKMGNDAIKMAIEFINYINNLTAFTIGTKTTPLDPALYFNPGEIGVECLEDKNGRLVVISQNINPATLGKI